eukprot:TRINITY_DN4888_c0_g1_i1.p1 TRINITY_DN4888_c0_g1~~TRINITY_DN4888_c0_g1_i1.p1  ORF type:complete len:439 (-),score=131.49 TRINITY_DN4888_c0_g1_i1:46-1362(-)
MKKKVAEAFESPIQKLTRDVANLSKIDFQNLDRQELRKTLLDLMRSLGNSDLYRPTFERLFKVVDLDETTKNWLMDQFCQDSLPLVPPRSAPPASAQLMNSNLPQSDRSPPLMIDKQLEASLQSCEFEVWGFTNEQLIPLWEYFFQDLGLSAQFRIPPLALNAFLRAALAKYHEANPYHNVRHAFDVTQTIFAWLKTNTFNSFVPPLEKFALVVAALCHDLDHPGLSNQYMINTQSDLALTYNDRSVLENFHVYHTFLMLQNPDCNITANLSAVEAKCFRRTLISAVLATDMSYHFELVSRFTTQLETSSLSADDPKHRELVINILLHAADISNPVKSFRTAKKWADLVFEEFLNQGDLEKKHGLPVSPYMDRNNTDQVKLSINFLNYMVKPLFSSLAKFSRAAFEQLVVNMTNNQAEWEARGAQSQPLPEGEPQEPK